MVLEWLPESLRHIVTHTHAIPWIEFYDQIGRPILDALRHAHVRRIAHRDLKPDNVLFGADRVPKLADFGIARSTGSPQLGLTLKNAGSKPYTPVESDDGTRSEGRDVYSWAAIALTVLTGRLFREQNELYAALRALRDGEAPKPALLRALSLEPDERQRNATELLADTDAFHDRVLSSTNSQLTVSIEWKPTVLSQAQQDLAQVTSETVNELVFDDLNQVCGARIDEGSQPAQIELVGATVRILAVVEPSRRRSLVANYFSCLPHGAAQVARQQLAVLRSVNFQPRTASASGVAEVSSFLNRVRTSENLVSLRNEKEEKERPFECWSGYLRERERLLRNKKRSLKASRLVRKGKGDRWIAEIEDDFSPDEVGDSVVVYSAGSRPLIFSVDAIEFDRIDLTLLAGSASRVPENGALLEANVEAERQSILRQRNALEEIRHDRAISAHLKQALSTPQSCKPPELSGLMNNATVLDGEMRSLLEKCIGCESVFAIEGPPGTGKTTLIAELITVYLKRFPDRRVLLTSQTHVALDHVIAKLQQKGFGDHIVRVASAFLASAEKLAEHSREITLEKKTRRWCETAEQKARSMLAARGKALGLNSSEIEVAIVAETMVAVQRRIEAIKAEIGQLEKSAEEVEERGQRDKDKGELIDKQVVIMETVAWADKRSRLLGEIETLAARERRLAEQLRDCGEYGAAIVEAAPHEQHEWIVALDNKTSHGRAFRRLVELQLSWFDRLCSERSLEPAALSDSKVVAGTCLGLASNFAVYQDEYDLCIVDEASKATATEALVPMARCRAFILLGDPKQLAPFEDRGEMLRVDGFTEREVRKTLLDVMLEGLPQTNVGRLRRQRRMVRGIGELISDVFYKSELEHEREDEDRNVAIARAFRRPVTWISTSRRGYKEMSSAGTSFRNPGEASVVLSLLQPLQTEAARSRFVISIAVLSAYAAQVRALREAIENAAAAYSNLQIEVNTVDAFQGRDADICIYSVVRSNVQRQLGFQREETRLNVALSRAKDALVIVGDDSFCRTIHRNNPFIDVLNYISSHPETCEIIER